MGQNVASGYCPLDLFSPQESRVTKAVQDLWDAWYESQGTVNNLKIFVHGKIVKPTDVRIFNMLVVQLKLILILTCIESLGACIEIIARYQ